jgi:hypothetical protein
MFVVLRGGMFYQQGGRLHHLPLLALFQTHNEAAIRPHEISDQRERQDPYSACSDVLGTRSALLNTEQGNKGFPVRQCRVVTGMHA